MNKQTDKQKLREHIHAIADEKGINIDRIEIDDQTAMMRQTVIVRLEKRLAPGLSQYRQLQATLEFLDDMKDADPQYDVMANELEMHVEGLKQDLTRHYDVAGHELRFYPFDDGKIFCPRCKAEFEYDGVNSFQFDKVPRIAKYIHGWAYENPCDDVIDEDMMNNYGDVNYSRNVR